MMRGWRWWGGRGRGDDELGGGEKGWVERMRERG